MDNNIYDVLAKLVKFFKEGDYDKKTLNAIRNFFGLEVLHLDAVGDEAAYLAVTGTTKTALVLFTCKRLPRQPEQFQMFCKDGSVTLLEYQIPTGKNTFIKQEINGWIGVDMLSVGKDFVHGVRSDNLKNTEQKFALNIIEKLSEF